jgi:hypothetical protein
MTEDQAVSLVERFAAIPYTGFGARENVPSSARLK